MRRCNRPHPRSAAAGCRGARCRRLRRRATAAADGRARRRLRAETNTEGEPETSTDDEAASSEDGAPPPADTEVSGLTSFSSPSGNIGCLIDRESVRCDIAERDWQPPAKPADCKLDYGQGLTLAAGGGAEFVCAGDTALNATTSGAPLPYGESISAGLLRCESAESGISCREIESGRGFSLSREAYEIF